VPKIARIGDKGTHGATIVEGSSTMFANGIGVARKGDRVSCPEHGDTTIVSNTATSVQADNKDVAIVGSVCACGAVINEGSPDVEAE
jgi:uncharacterized Zn-binding protein involved in type VI secretion